MTGRHHDLVNFTKRYKGEVHEFYLDLKSWRKFKTRYNLSWKKIKFSESNQAMVPRLRGIYVFTVELSPSKLPEHGYILYMGITGDTSDANLYKRFGQYVGHLRNEDGRPAVFYMLRNWADDLFFNYVALTDPSVSLAKLETAFINALIPPVNKRDFTPEITSVKAAKF